MVPLPFVFNYTKAVVKAAGNARLCAGYPRMLSPFCPRRLAARWALKRDDVTSGRATLREKTFPHFTHSSPRFSSHQPSCLACKREEAQRCLGELPSDKGDGKYLLCSHTHIVKDNRSYYSRGRYFYGIIDIFFDEFSR